MSVQCNFTAGQHHVVGRGRLGRTLEAGLEQTGRNLTADIERADVVWFCLPESVLSTVYSRRFPELPPNAVRLHTSGYLPASVLQKPGSGPIGALHPAFSFPTPLESMPEQILWTFEGDPALQPAVRELVQDWGGTLHVLRPEDKAAYHVICVLLANLTGVPAGIAKKLSGEIGIPFKQLTDSLMMPVLQRIREGDADGYPCMTGPAARGDWETVYQQADWLETRDPVAASVYRTLSEAVREYRCSGASGDAGTDADDSVKKKR